MSSIPVENYKKTIQNITSKFGKEIAKAAVDLEKVEKDLKPLEALKDPGDDDQKKLDDLRKQAAALQKRIDNCVLNMQTSLRAVDPPSASSAPKNELQALPGWLKTIIENQGIPIGDGMSIAPNIKIDIKAKKIDEFGITLTIKWD